MKIKYNKLQFEFEIKSKSLKFLKTSTSDFDNWTICENEYFTEKNDIDISVRIIDFTKNAKFKDYALSANEYVEILEGYIGDIKMTGMVNHLENIEQAEDGWDKFSGVLKVSQNKFSYNHFCAKRFSNYMIVASIGSTDSVLLDIKEIGKEFITTFKEVH